MIRQIAIGWEQAVFEHYTEKARRVIFFARSEAGQFGSPQIEPEHLLLGILHESQPCPKVPNALISHGLCLYDTKN